MSNPKVQIQRLSHGEGIDLPFYATSHAAGADLRAAVDDDVIIQPGDSALIKTGFAMALPPFGMAKDHKLRARIGDHRRRNIPGKRAAFGMMAILRADRDLFGFAVNRVDQSIRRRERDLHLHVTLGSPVDRACFGQHCAGAVHLPVSDNIWSAVHGFILHLDN